MTPRSPEFNVAAAIGRLVGPQLRLLVRLYDIERHYKAVKNKWISFAGSAHGKPALVNRQNPVLATSVARHTGPVCRCRLSK
jgi:hypothetical protein